MRPTFFPSSGSSSAGARRRRAVRSHTQTTVHLPRVARWSLRNRLLGPDRAPSLKLTARSIEPGFGGQECEPSISWPHVGHPVPRRGAARSALVGHRRPRLLRRAPRRPAPRSRGSGLPSPSRRTTSELCILGLDLRPSPRRRRHEAARRARRRRRPGSVQQQEVLLSGAQDDDAAARSPCAFACQQQRPRSARGKASTSFETIRCGKILGVGPRDAHVARAGRRATLTDVTLHAPLMSIQIDLSGPRRKQKLIDEAGYDPARLPAGPVPDREVARPGTLGAVPRTRPRDVGLQGLRRGRRAP